MYEVSRNGIGQYLEQGAGGLAGSVALKQRAEAGWYFGLSREPASPVRCCS